MPASKVERSRAAERLRAAAAIVEEAKAACAGDADIAANLDRRASGLRAYAEWLETELQPGLTSGKRKSVMLDRTGITCTHCEVGFGTSTIGYPQSMPGARTVSWEDFVQMVAQSHSSSCPSLGVDPR
jgi:hypothetical protein